MPAEGMRSNLDIEIIAVYVTSAHAAARLESASVSITVPNVTGAASALRGLVSCRVGNTGS